MSGMILTMKNQRISVYGISNCDTVKKARAWLTAQGMDYEFHDFKKLGVPERELALWIDALGWEKLVNRKGTTWRALNAATQASVIDAGSAIAAIRVSSSLIKRPVVRWASGEITVGFDANTWQALCPPA